MWRCCPETCQHNVCSADDCEKLTGLGTCMFPNDAMRKLQVQKGETKPYKHKKACAADSDICLQQSAKWGTKYKCATSLQWCNSWAKDLLRCCPDTCGAAACTADECNKLPGLGSCTYPNPALKK